MSEEHENPRLRTAEFVALMALMSSLVALSIDAMLPALPEIGRDLGVQDENDIQFIVIALFLGLAIGQMLYGPLSDSVGRKPAIYLGFALFAAGTLLSVFAASFSAMLVGRVLQGVGAAGPRIVSIALMRDLYEGRAMARIVSLTMSVFILVPAIAPALGQAILLVAHWRMIFGLLFGLALVAAIWFASRQPETLPRGRRLAFSLDRIVRAIQEICDSRVSFGYSVAGGLVFGAFVGYLSSVQPILQVQYGLGELFPGLFAVLALAVGAASFANARLVMMYGMRRMVHWALYGVCGLSWTFLVVAFVFAGHPPLWAFMTNFTITFFGIGILIGNFNSLAMEPLGHIAGIGAAVVGSLMTLVSLSLGALVSQSYDGTVVPLVLGFAVYGTASLFVAKWVARGGSESVSR